MMSEVELDLINGLGVWEWSIERVDENEYPLFYIAGFNFKFHKHLLN
jgi:hypothetical protein